LNLKDLEWKVLPKDFIEKVKLCSVSVSRDSGMGVLGGMLIMEKEIMSSDNYRVSWGKLSSTMERFILPYLGSIELCKIGGLDYYSLGEGWVHFKNEEGLVFSSRRHEGDYPVEEIKKIFTGKKSSEYSFPKGSLQSLGIVKFMSSCDEDAHEEEYVIIESEGTNLIYRGEREYGKIFHRVKIKKEGFPKIRFKITLRFLEDILSSIDTFYILEDKFIVFKKENFQHLVAMIGEE
jgi:hypothetical protein